jgi:hypothetical protein
LPDLNTATKSQLNSGAWRRSVGLSRFLLQLTAKLKFGDFGSDAFVQGGFQRKPFPYQRFKARRA